MSRLWDCMDWQTVGVLLLFYLERVNKWTSSLDVNQLLYLTGKIIMSAVNFMQHEKIILSLFYKVYYTKCSQIDKNRNMGVLMQEDKQKISLQQ